MTEINEKEDLLLLDKQLCFPLYACARKIVAAYHPFLKKIGLTYTQYITFMVLWEKDGLTVGEIGSRLHLDNGTLTPMLKKMEKQGYVNRHRDPDDERRVVVDLTDLGRELKAKLADVPLKISRCAPLDSAEANILYHTLNKILDD